MKTKPNRVSVSDVVKDGTALTGIVAGLIAAEAAPNTNFPTSTLKQTASKNRVELGGAQGIQRSVSLYQRFEAPIPDPEWNDTCNDRFCELAEKEALEEITEDETTELEHLTAQRRRSVAPRTGSDILRDYKARKKTMHLIEALESYVEFFTPKDQNKV